MEGDSDGFAGELTGGWVGGSIVKVVPGGPGRSGPEPAAMPNAKMQDDGSAIVTWPADVWFDGKRTFAAKLSFVARRIAKLTLDPKGRFPDANPRDNVWPRSEPAVTRS